MEDLLKQMEQPSVPAAAATGLIFESVNPDELFGIFDDQIADENRVRTAQQLQVIKAIDNYETEQVSLWHWAHQQIETLKSRLDLSQITPQQRASISTELLPVTRELFRNVDESVAISLQCTAIKRMVRERLASNPMSASAPVPALRGVSPLRLSGN